MATSNSLTLAEKKFLLYVERGDVASARRALLQAQADVNMNTNCVDPLGRSALVIAIQNENTDLINLLLNFGVHAKDALLHAIREEYVEAVEILLEHEEKVHQEGQPYNWECVDPDMATYDHDITPIIVAAHKNNFEIIKMLLDRGATLPVPHHVKCGCDECVSSSYLDGLGHSRSRINAFAALASPSLIALSSKDPILTAFELSAELRRLSVAETHFQSEYQTLRRQVEGFATSLVDNTHSSQELSVILNHDHTLDIPAGRHGERMQLARLRMAAKYRQKKFVAHANVQQLLTSVWYHGMPAFRRKNTLGQILEICCISIMLPLSWIIYTIAPSSSWGRKLQLPFVKFINHCTSYCFFLSLLVMVTQQVEQSAFEFFGSVARKSGSKGDLPTYVEMAIAVYIIGFIVADIETLWRVGIGKYVSDIWNIADMVMNLLYITWILLRTYAWYQVHELRKLGVKVPMIREEWSTHDPMLISEAVFSSANILSFLKIVHMFPVNHHLGPLQISLGRMIYDIIKFFFIYMLVLFAFGCGMNQLLWYYAEMDKKKCYNILDPSKMNPNAEMSCEIWRRFSNLFETSQSLFWASFGLVDIKNFELTGIKSYTRFWALLMFGFYSVINIVVLLNLLIAMMSNSYQTISAQADKEWKFARTKLWLKYFEKGATIPPPFNILPMPKSLLQLFGIHRHLKCTSSERNENPDMRHSAVMRNLVLRFIKNEQRISEEQGITEDDVKEIKQDISTFRYDLIDIFRNNGIDCPSVYNENPLGGGKKERNRLRRLMKGINTSSSDQGLEPEQTQISPLQMQPSSKLTKDHQDLSAARSVVASSVEDSMPDSVVIDFPKRQQDQASLSAWI